MPNFKNNQKEPSENKSLPELLAMKDAEKYEVEFSELELSDIKIIDFADVDIEINKNHNPT